LSIFIRSNSIYANLSYLSIVGRIVPQAIRPYLALTLNYTGFNFKLLTLVKIL